MIRKQDLRVINSFKMQSIVLDMLKGVKQNFRLKSI